MGIVAVASAQGEKKVPPRHPLQRSNKLNKFAAEWCNANLSEKAAAMWEKKFDNNVQRFERDSNFADSMMKTNSHMVDQNQKTENDVKMMTLLSLTVKDLFAQDTTKPTQSVVSNKSPKVSPSGLNDMFQLANFNQPNKLSDQTNGSVN